MSDRNGYIKDEELPTLTRTELIDKVRTARQMWRKRETGFEAMQVEIADKDERLAELQEVGSVDIAAYEAKIETLETCLAERDQQIEALLAKLHEAGDQALNTACRAKHTYSILKSFHKVEVEERGGQHESAPSA